MPKHRQTAVDRNRLKRRLRELLRARWSELAPLPPQDLALYALPAAYEASFTDLRDDVARVLARVARQVAAA